MLGYYKCWLTILLTAWYKTTGPEFTMIPVTSKLMISKTVLFNSQRVCPLIRITFMWHHCTQWYCYPNYAYICVYSTLLKLFSELFDTTLLYYVITILHTCMYTCVASRHWYCTWMECNDYSGIISRTTAAELFVMSTVNEYNHNNKTVLLVNNRLTN